MAGPQGGRPRHGSMGFWPRKRARRIYPRIKTWPKIDEVKLLAFPGYKAGMTHVIAIDNFPNSPTKGEEIFVPVTVIETPPIKILSIRGYKNTPYGKLCRVEILNYNLDEDLKRKIKLPKNYSKEEFEKKINELKEKIEKGEIDDIKVVVYTKPKLSGLGKKKPEVLEIAIGGNNPKEKLEYVLSLLDKEIKASEVFKEGELVDVIAVTKGHGYTGAIARFGLKLRHHKSKKGRRRSWSKGPMRPHWVRHTVPMPGQYGFHRRTEYNKLILKISNVKEENINPKGGFINYGLVKGDYILLKGSTPGPKKRLIVLRKAIRPWNGQRYYEPMKIEYIYLESQQGK